MARSLVPAINKHAEAVQTTDVVICPPFPLLGQCHTSMTASNVFLGAQNVADQVSGAYTGEVSAGMLAEAGCQYVIIGHSERRQYYGDTDEIVAHKFTRIQEASLIPILCVGETLEQREQNLVEKIIEQQVVSVVNHVGIAAFANAVIAYEPIWAIGTGKTASPGQAEEVHAMIRQVIAQQEENIARELRILYGGSVKPDNAVELFSQENIDGGLIGGASLDAEQFNAIVSAAA
jgi:triosephosphate isomerase